MIQAAKQSATGLCYSRISRCIAVTYRCITNEDMKKENRKTLSVQAIHGQRNRDFSR